MSNSVIHNFKQNKTSLIALLFIAITTIVAILGYVITPDQSPFANSQNIELTTQKPGFKCKFLKVKKNENTENNNFLTGMIFGFQSEYKEIPIYKYTFEGADIVIEHYTGLTPNDGETEKINIADVLYNLQTNDNNIKVSNSTVSFKDIDNKNHSENIKTLQAEIVKSNIADKKFWLGTDRFGRDLLSQLMIGTRVSLSVGFISVLISLLIGITLGLMAGYFKGWVDNVIMWLINVIWSIPTILLVMVISFALGKGFWQVFIAVGLTMWVEVARIVRGKVLSVREKEYVQAAKVLGFSNTRIMFRHILPNVIDPVIVISAANFASAILIEAGLSFLGIGVQPPMPSWGTMIKEHYGYIILDMAYLAIIPGVAIMLLVLAFMIIGNGLRDALDVKSVNVQ